MPDKKGRFKRYNKKGRRYKRKNALVRPGRNLGPLGVKLKTKFIYSDRFVLNPPGVGIADTVVFSANGLFDPNITGAGHQPRGFDQLIGVLYDHAVVIASKITVYATNTDTADSSILAITLRDTTTSTTVVENIQENRYVKNTILAPLNSGVNSRTLTMACNPNDFLGVSKPLSQS